MSSETYAGNVKAWTAEAWMIWADRTILQQRGPNADGTGITATADGEREPCAIHQALRRSAVVVEITLLSPVHIPSGEPERN